MNSIIINGKKFSSISGSNISIGNNNVIVNGVSITSDLNTGIVEVKFEGDLASLQCSGNVTVNGNVKGNIDAGGSVQCQSVGGDVDSGGSVKCSKVGGSIDAGGSVVVK